MKKILSALVLVVGLSFAALADETYQLVWTTTTAEHDQISGYRVKWGTESGVYTDQAQLGNKTTQTYNLVLPINDTYYVSIFTYNGTDESDPGNEVEIVVPGLPVVDDLSVN